MKNTREIVINLREACKNHTHHSVVLFVHQYLDSRLHKYFKQGNEQYKCIIIVGKGMNSKHTINGTHIIKWATETYLQQVGITYRTGNIFEGQDGVLVCYI